LPDCTTEKAYQATFRGNETDLSFQSFQYLDLNLLLDSMDCSCLIILERFQSTSPIIIDKIECVPVCITQKQYENNQHIIEAQEAVNQLFTNSSRDTLQSEITDYDVDQAAKKIELISDSIALQEKIILLRDVKHAKRLSKRRNLLQNEDFEFPGFINKNSWQFTHHIRISCNDPKFKGYFLEIPSVYHSIRNEEFVYRHAYQKIDESKLKSYTRYIVRGFIGECEDLEIYVTRYAQEVKSLQNVKHSIHKDTITSHEKAHYFTFEIDVGNVDRKMNLGIWVAFQITTLTGRATLGNIEVIEMMPLSGNACKKIKKKEQEWEKENERRQLESEKSIQMATNAVGQLFENSKDQELSILTSKKDIFDALEKVNNIPYVYHPYLKHVLGMNSDIYIQLQERINHAFHLDQARNKVGNGGFLKESHGWQLTSGVNFQKKENGDISMLMTHWSASVVQDIVVEPTSEYLLRVTAIKNSEGNGYVVISSCTSEYIQAVSFTANEGSENIHSITKTFEVFPKTNRIQIEIGTTDGTFVVENVELICIEDSKI
uniref:toxin Cry1Ac domain D-VI-related protein n=1 Tax=Bacillus cereus TaxID=1396 RepID=UPI0005CE1589